MEWYPPKKDRRKPKDGDVDKNQLRLEAVVKEAAHYADFLDFLHAKARLEDACCKKT